jgi:hypothetical protein
MSNFHDNLNNVVYRNLKRDNPKSKETSTHINDLKCPACGKNEGFAHRDSPMAIMCHRFNNCGATTPIKLVYPELWQDLAKQYPPTPTDKKATARAYLESRCLNPELIEFKQGYVDNHQTLIIEHDGVKFQRLIDYKGKDKNRLNAYKGKVFETKGVKDSETVFIVEGVINALSLEQAGQAAIATYSSGAIPKDYYQQNKGKAFVIAFDNDTAGIKGIQKTIDCFNELGMADEDGYKIALPPTGKDWNDLLVGKQLAPDTIDKILDEAYWQGKLAFASSPVAYFDIYRERYPNASMLIFEFKYQTFKGYLREIKEKGVVVDYETKAKLLADCSMRLLHSVIDDSQDDKQRMEHYIELYSKREGKGHIRMDATELVRLDAFKAALQNHRQLFYGNSDDLTNLASYLFKQYPKPPKIRALSVVGYDDKSKGYYFPKFMYDVNGKRIDANSDKYFTEANIKPFMDCSDTVTNRLESIDLKRFITLLFTAYGNKGLLALGFYVSSLFSHLVFEHYNFFPFLSLCGDPHAGKSFVSRLLNACLFIFTEGQAMTASNTAKGELRKISQKSSLVCALLEGRKDKSRFDYDGILPLYNRNALYSRATTSQDNRTHDLPLKAAISFVWNHECFTLKPAKERVISLHFADSDNNETTGAAWTELNSFTPEQLASVGHYLLTNRKLFESELIQWIKDFAGELKAGGIGVTRIAENHAIALAGIALLVKSLKMTDTISVDNDLLPYTIERAKHKLENAKTESHIADYFFQSIAGLDTGAGVATNSDNELVVHLPTVLEYLQKNNNGFNNKGELIASLKGHDRFIVVKTSKAFAKPCDAYHFKPE